ncbi:hypothetical protein C6A85_67780, partial [Mycobacterium sp. ITM-2017-0098]
MKVVKSGISSGVTFGVVDGLNSERISVMPGTAPAASGEVSLPGDSGSIWLEMATNLAVACITPATPKAVPEVSALRPSGSSRC